MKGLSLIQPWATLLALGEKEYETRSWATRYRGPIAIHASRLTKDAIEWCHEEPYAELLEARGYRYLNQLPFGAVIAVAELRAIHRTDQMNHLLTDQEIALGDFSDGRYAWAFRDMRLLPEPIPHRGYPGLWEFDTALLHRRGSLVYDESGLPVGQARRLQQ